MIHDDLLVGNVHLLKIGNLLHQLGNLRLLHFRLFELGPNLVLESTVDLHEIVIESGELVDSIERFDFLCFIHVPLFGQLVNTCCQLLNG